MAKNLNTLLGEVVAFTGRAWKPRSELRKLVRRLGGSVTPRSDVTDETTVLVRGNCAVWKFGDYGRKEQRAAQLVSKGRSIAVVHDFELRKLVERGRPARVNDRISGQPVDWLKPPTERHFEIAASFSGPLDREFTAHGRVEQSYLRQRLFGDADDAQCCLCGRSLPTSLLVAAHIKPRSECSRRERSDTDNVVFGLCLLGCDALYERGLVAVRPGGSICFSRVYPNSDLKRASKYYHKRKCRAWTEARAAYFDWHLRNRFQG